MIPIDNITKGIQGAGRYDQPGDLFFRDIMKGLSASPKQLPSKYFYDAAGDKLFQQIMNCDAYYPFNCELEIFQESTALLADAVLSGGPIFDLIELGAGDATKSSYLLRYLVDRGANFTYMPIDISSNIINYLGAHLPDAIPGLKVSGLNGEYFDMLDKAAVLSRNRKVVLFLGSNLGNMPVADAAKFCCELRGHLRPGDIAIVGLDLKKNPATILAAYNDPDGLTRDFNLNLLHRINRELSADFNVTQFAHFPFYDPGTGSCKSYLISKQDQEVHLGTGDERVTVLFKENEEIFMEISQKYTVEQVADLAAQASFKTSAMLFDHKHWFTDAIWEAQ